LYVQFQVVENFPMQVLQHHRCCETGWRKVSKEWVKIRY